MVREKSLIEKSLRKKGFREDQSHHHYFIYYTEKGQKTKIFTKTSHTPKCKDIGDVLLKLMATQVKLSKAEFIDFIDCSLSQSEYEKQVFYLDDSNGPVCQK
jgi:hypothetical protein